MSLSLRLLLIFQFTKKYGHEEGRTANNGHRDNILCGMGLLLILVLHGSKPKLEKLCSSLMFCGHFLDEIQHALLFVNVRW